MSAYKELIETLVAAYGRRMPLRDVYYRCFHKRITGCLGKIADHSLQDECFITHLAKLTGVENLKFDLATEEKNAIIADADKSLRKHFEMLGSGDIVLNPIKWSTDFIHGYEWPKGIYYKKYTQVDLTNNADVKVPRELSRCHHLLRLALAYRLTGEEKYAQTVIEHITDWIDENPLMYSINWGCAMDVGIRAVNWIWALSLIHGNKTSHSDYGRIKKSLYKHGWFIFHNLEGSNLDYNNNHYFSDIVGLLHIALLFKSDKDASNWLRFAIKTFFRETRLQVLPSGMSFECSTNYHRLVLELVMTSVILLDRNGYDIPPDIWQRLEKMFEFVMKLTMPDGKMPIVGDQDNGRLLPFGVEDLNDHRYLLSVGALLFNRGDFKYKSLGYNIYTAILVPNCTYADYVNLPDIIKPLDSELIRDAGFALMRKDDSYLLFNVDNQGMYRDTGTHHSHTHSDWFSFVLCVNGIPLIVDPGSYVYSSNFKMRNMFRSSAMHNTVVIDGDNQAKMDEGQLWAWYRDTTPKLLNWQSDDIEDHISCEYERTINGNDPFKHTRSLEFDKQKMIWIINDRVKGIREHKNTVYFHLDVDVQPILHDNTVLLTSNSEEISMSFESDRPIILSIENSNLSKGYGNMLSSKVIKVETVPSNDWNLKTKIWEKRG